MAALGHPDECCVGVSNSLELANAGNVRAGSETAGQRLRIVLNIGVAAAIRMECWRLKVTGRPAELRDLNTAKDLAITAAVTN